MKKLAQMFKGAPKAKVAKLAYAFLGIIVSGAILVAATTSFAWFSRNQRTDANAMEIKTAQDDTEATYTVYTYDTKQNKGVDTASLEGGFQLNTHDVVFTSENIHNAAFVKIVLTGSKYQNKAGTLSVSIARSTAADNAQNPLTETLSSVAQFAYTTDVSYAADANADAIYTALFAKFCDGETGMLKTTYTDGTDRMSFVSYTSTTVDGVTTYSNFNKSAAEIEFANISYAAGDWNNNKLCVYLCICYDEIPVNKIVDKSDFMQLVDIGKSKTMANDLTSITVSFATPAA